MSDPVSVLAGATFDGLARIEEQGLCGMITLRGDFAAAGFAAAVKAATGAALPDVRKLSTGDKGAVAWMSPDELLVLVDHDRADAVVADLSAALEGSHHLVVNVSDARACFSVSGEGAREVMAKLAPVDFAPGSFGTGDFRRTRLAQVAGATWLDEDGAFHIVCFRSVAQYVFDLLKVSSDQPRATGLNWVAD